MFPVGVVGDAVAVDEGNVSAVVEIRAGPAVGVDVVSAGEGGATFCAVLVSVVAGGAVCVGVVEEQGSAGSDDVGAVWLWAFGRPLHNGCVGFHGSSLWVFCGCEHL